MKNQLSKGGPKKKINRPVSEKFYDSLCSRVIAAAKVIDLPLLGADVMIAVDKYINEGIQPSGHSTELMLIFTLVKPEIDKAMARSAAARKRRKQRAVETTEPVAESRDEVMEEAAAEGGFTGNRRERRRQEQEQRRLARRKQRRVFNVSTRPLNS
ncbi:MAG: hypothetical protein NC212_04440 [Staphylococcus sp.]|nr:hypothetical protein [Staphylococcus sp.]